MKKVYLILLIFLLTVFLSNPINAYELDYEKTVTYPVDMVNITLTGEGVSVDANYNSDLEWDIYQYINDEILNTDSNITSLKTGIRNICSEYGVENPDIYVNTPYGEGSFIFNARLVGISMEPTLHEGSVVVVNKTHDIHVGDIVIAVYPSNYGSICKRVGKIDGNMVYLVSDNVRGTLQRNGKTYEYEGIRTWANISDIQGVVIDIKDNDEIIRIE